MLLVAKISKFTNDKGIRHGKQNSGFDKKNSIKYAGIQ